MNVINGLSCEQRLRRLLLLRWPAGGLTFARMDHKAFLSSLSPGVKSELTKRSDRAGLTHLAGHAGAILCGAVLIAVRVPFWPMLIPVQGILIAFLFTLEHECTHKTPFANARLNEVVGLCCGFLLLLPFTWFRYFHLAHHRWTNIDGQDPELASGRPETRWAWARHVSGLPFWIAGARLTLRLARGREQAAYLPDNALPRMEQEARGMLAGYALVVLSLLVTPLLFWIWLLPVALGQPALRLYVLAEHGDCPRVANMFENTRTTFTTALMRFIAWNMPFHAEHHVYPAVPFHRLPDLHRRMKQDLHVTSDGYAAFTRAYLARRGWRA